MNKYWVFRELLDFMADHTDVVDANMNNYLGGMTIVGEDDESKITIEVTIRDKDGSKSEPEKVEGNEAVY